MESGKECSSGNKQIGECLGVFAAKQRRRREVVAGTSKRERCSGRNKQKRHEM